MPSEVLHLSPAVDPDLLEAVAPAPVQLSSVTDFNAVYRAEFPFVWRTLRALGVATSSLDDAVQDVFIVVHRQLPGFEQRASLRSWIFAIAYNVASNHRRREYRKGGLIPLHPEIQAPDPDPEARLNQTQAWDFLSSFLDQLDEGKRAVFVLTQLEGFKATEVAEALGIPPNTVYTRLHNAKLAFRDAIASSRKGAVP